MATKDRKVHADENKLWPGKNGHHKLSSLGSVDTINSVVLSGSFYNNKILWFGSKLFRLKVDGFQFNKAQFSAQCHASNIEDFHAVVDLNFTVLPLIVKLR